LPANLPHRSLDDHLRPLRLSLQPAGAAFHLFDGGLIFPEHAVYFLIQSLVRHLMSSLMECYLQQTKDITRTSSVVILPATQPSYQLVRFPQTLSHLFGFFPFSQSLPTPELHLVFDFSHTGIRYFEWPRSAKLTSSAIALTTKRTSRNTAIHLRGLIPGTSPERHGSLPHQPEELP
jgi:hypothetical protein